MKNQLVSSVENHFFKELNLPEFRPGDTVSVHYKIKEGSDKKKYRIQIFSGVVIKFKKGGVSSSFTVRKISANNIGVERIFPLYSPYIQKVDIKSKGIVRRAKLYYLRKLSGKKARIKSKYIGSK